MINLTSQAPVLQTKEGALRCVSMEAQRLVTVDLVTVCSQMVSLVIQVTGAVDLTQCAILLTILILNECFLIVLLVCLR